MIVSNNGFVTIPVYDNNSNIIGKAPSNDETAVSSNTKSKELDKVTISSVTDEYIKSKEINMPMKIYADNVIKDALRNIESGNDVDRNIRLVRIFSTILQENSETTLIKGSHS